MGDRSTNFLKHVTHQEKMEIRLPHVSASSGGSPTQTNDQSTSNVSSCNLHTSRDPLSSSRHCSSSLHGHGTDTSSAGKNIHTATAVSLQPRRRSQRASRTSVSPVVPVGACESPAAVSHANNNSMDVHSSSPHNPTNNVRCRNGSRCCERTRAADTHSCYYCSDARRMKAQHCSCNKTHSGSSHSPRHTTELHCMQTKQHQGKTATAANQKTPAANTCAPPECVDNQLFPPSKCDTSAESIVVTTPASLFFPQSVVTLQELSSSSLHRPHTKKNQHQQQHSRQQHQQQHSRQQHQQQHSRQQYQGHNQKYALQQQQQHEQNPQEHNRQEQEQQQQHSQQQQQQHQEHQWQHKPQEQEPQQQESHEQEKQQQQHEPQEEEQERHSPQEQQPCNEQQQQSHKYNVSRQQKANGGEGARDVPRHFCLLRRHSAPARSLMSKEVIETYKPLVGPYCGSVGPVLSVVEKATTSAEKMGETLILATSAQHKEKAAACTPPQLVTLARTKEGGGHQSEKNAAGMLLLVRPASPSLVLQVKSVAAAARATTALKTDATAATANVHMLESRQAAAEMRKKAAQHVALRKQENVSSCHIAASHGTYRSSVCQRSITSSAAAAAPAATAASAATPVPAAPSKATDAAAKVITVAATKAKANAAAGGAVGTTAALAASAGGTTAATAVKTVCYPSVWRPTGATPSRGGNPQIVNDDVVEGNKREKGRGESKYIKKQEPRTRESKSIREQEEGRRESQYIKKQEPRRGESKSIREQEKGRGESQYIKKQEQSSQDDGDGDVGEKEEGAQCCWERVLWKKKQRRLYADNYFDDSFLCGLVYNARNRCYSYSSLCSATVVITQHFSLLIIFTVVYTRFRRQKVDGWFLVLLSLLLLLLGHAVRWMLQPSWRGGRGGGGGGEGGGGGGAAASQRTQKKEKVFAQCMFLWCLMTMMMGLMCVQLAAPILRTLTESFSDDTVISLSIACYVLHIALTDYSHVRRNPDRIDESLTRALSINAALLANVVLASRLSSSTDVFGVFLFGIEMSTLSPLMRRMLWQQHPRLFVYGVTPTLVLLTALLLLLEASWSLVILYLFGCPCIQHPE